MPEHLRALVVILVLATPVWWVAKDAFSDLLPSGTFARWRNLWVLVSLALFLSRNYWLFALLLFAMVLTARRREAHAVGLFFVLLFAGSPVPVELPGFGFVNYFLIIDHYSLLTLSLLLPAAVVLMQDRRTISFGTCPTDFLFLAYFLLICALEFRAASFTNGARGVVTQVIRVFLPYYVVSRSIRDIDGFNAALSGFVIAACLLAPVAVFEAERGWRLYTAVQALLAPTSAAWSGYLGRAGLLRAVASLGQPIVLGFVFMVALGFMMFLRRRIERGWHRWVLSIALVLGLLASLSRGPWVGAVLLGLVIAISSRKPMQNLVKAGLLVATLMLVVSALPVGQKLIDLLPFLGTEESGTIDYRVELWSFVEPVVQRNLWLGSENFRSAPELQALAAIQGQGIVDLVNSYFAILLSGGVIGLTLFSATFARSIHAVWCDMRWRALTQEQQDLGRALLGTLLAVLVTISTVSSITAVPVILWSVLGLCAAYSAMLRQTVRQRAGSPASGQGRLLADGG